MQLEDVLSVLPQTQCRQCGFDGCAQYAKAIVDGKAPINRCAPGGAKGIAQLAKVTEQSILPLDTEYGVELPHAVAKISAKTCIGCALCAVACPVDCLTGLPKHLFAVIEEACTGCGLCVCACPVNAIEMEESGRTWTAEDADLARKAFEARKERLKARKAARDERLKHTESQKANILASVLAAAQIKKS